MTGPDRVAQHEDSRCFPASLRLLKRSDFQRVFERPRRIPGRAFMVLYRPARVPQPQARLGLAVTKKHARRAVDRNRIRRVAREAFRHLRATLPAVDIIVLSRAGVAQRDCAALREELDQLLEHVK